MKPPASDQSYVFGTQWDGEISLSSTIYRSIANGALQSGYANGIGEGGVQPFPSDFYDYIMSNSNLLNSHPFLRTCYTGYWHGIPSVKIRVSALTADNYNTVTSPGVYSTAGAPISPAPTAHPAPGSIPQGPAASTFALPPHSPVSLPKTGGEQASATPALQHESPSMYPSSSSSRVQEIQPATPSVAQSPDSVGLSTNSHIGNTNPQPSDQAASSSQYLPGQGSSNPGASNPGASNPGASNPGASNPGAGNPGSSNPGSSSPGSDKPGSSNPTSTNVGAPPFVPSAPSNEPGSLPQITTGISTYAANSNSKYYVGTNTLVPGAQPATLSNTPYSLAPLASELVIGASTIRIGPNAPAITIGNLRFTTDSTSNYVIGTQTLIPGGNAIMIDAVLYSLAPSATAFISGGSTIGLAPTQVATGAPVLTIDGRPQTANSESQYIIGSQTLKFKMGASIGPHRAINQAGTLSCAVALEAQDSSSEKFGLTCFNVAVPTDIKSDKIAQ